MKQHTITAYVVFYVAAAGLFAVPGEAADRSTATVSGWRLVLSDCDLDVSGPGGHFRHKFNFPPPCQFSGDRQDEVQAIRVDKGVAVLVEAARPRDRRCDTYLQAVVIQKDSVGISEEIQNVRLCPSKGGWDDVMYRTLANRVRPLQSLK
jgi:hypothetical protein